MRTLLESHNELDIKPPQLSIHIWCNSQDEPQKHSISMSLEKADVCANLLVHVQINTER